MNKKQIKKSLAIKYVISILFMILIINIFEISIFANTESFVGGNIFEFSEGNEYEFSNSENILPTGKDSSYGKFFVSGDINDIYEKEGIPAYEVSGGNIEINYNYSDSLLNADEENWHFVDDKSKRVDDIKLEKNIQKGVIILQTSKDRKNWRNIDIINNTFENQPIRTNYLYKTKDVEILNGCYYRVIVAYKIGKLIKKDKILFVPIKDFEYKRVAEVYEFYAHYPETEQNFTSNQTYQLGEKVKVKKFDGYFGEDFIAKNDIHYGWDIGQFFVSGYTDKIQESDGNIVFLKNVGDTVTLWFNLKQNINAINGNDKLKITADTNGYDQYFQIPRMNFGRGTLIVRHTDYSNQKSEPQIYTNYLEANTTLEADTKVQLFEEGDYEVALDYEITKDEFIDTVGHYRIFFKYSVRNGNCMIYPLDIVNGNELTNSSITEKGFVLDLAKSRYLQINIKREVLNNGLLDTRWNRPAKDGAEYTEEGIYTITAMNKYTNQTTTKKIYVGNDKVLKALMTSGLSVKEVNELMLKGATIDESGVIEMPDNSVDSTFNFVSVIDDKIIISAVFLLFFMGIKYIFVKHKEKNKNQR